jgi:restriction system protein
LAGLGGLNVWRDNVRSWLVRAGRHGEREQFAVDHGFAVVGWHEIGDLSSIASRDEMVEAVREAHVDAAEKKVINHAAQLWAFVNRIEEGDIVVLPLKAAPALAIGRVTGPYRFEPDNPADARHVRPVEWVRTDVPRSAIGQDLLHSLGAFLTVCEIKRNSATVRLSGAMTTGKDPGAAAFVSTNGAGAVEAELDDESAPVDIEQLARDRMRAFIAEKFTGHDLARLVDAVLRAQGFVTYRSPAGPDGGVDVLAGAGPLGTESPRICVQVKAGDSPVDVKVVRELHGVLSTVNADQALLVAWAGLNKAADAEARAQWFRMRVWTADDVIESVTSVYDRLPDELQAELPLKRIWTVVLDD